MKIYKNLKELLDGEGFGHEEAGYWARCVYKYTDCGPWVVFLMKNGAGLCYSDVKSRLDFDPTECVGIKIGSIVEGSDVEVGPLELRFPFPKEDLHKAFESVNDEAKFYWARDNTQNFIIYHNGTQVAGVSWTQFEDAPEWSVHPGAEIPGWVKKRFLKFVDVSVTDYDVKYEFAPGWELEEYVNDITY